MTWTSEEKGKSSKDLCFMFEATDLSIVKVSSYRVKLAGRLFSFPFFPIGKTCKVSVGQPRRRNAWESIHKKIMRFAFS